MKPNDLKLVRAEPSALHELLPFVAAYHAAEGISSTVAHRKEAVSALLADQRLGEIWQIHFRSQLIGYAAVCFGYSIEFAGRDAFIDEFFIAEGSRGLGIGTWVLGQLAADLSARDIRALHLEVDRQNTRARALYAKAGYQARERFHLMTRLL